MSIHHIQLFASNLRNSSSSRKINKRLFAQNISKKIII